MLIRRKHHLKRKISPKQHVRSQSAFLGLFFLTRNNYIQERISPNGMPAQKPIYKKNNSKTACSIPKCLFRVILAAAHGSSLTKTNSQLTCSYSKVPCLGIIFANTEEKSSQTKNKPKTACSIPKCLFGLIFPDTQ